MTTDLATRLTCLLDVMMDCNDISRRVAARVIGDRMQYSHDYVRALANGAAFVDRRRERHVLAVLSQMEHPYTAALRARRAYNRSCARHKEAA